MVVAKLKEGHYENFLVFPFLLAIDGLYSLPIVPLLWWTMALHCCIQQSKTLNHLSTMSDSRVTILLVVFLASVGGLSPSIIIALALGLHFVAMKTFQIELSRTQNSPMHHVSSLPLPVVNRIVTYNFTHICCVLV